MNDMLLNTRVKYMNVLLVLVSTVAFGFIAAFGQSDNPCSRIEQSITQKLKDNGDM